MNNIERSGDEDVGRYVGLADENDTGAYENKEEAKPSMDDLTMPEDAKRENAENSPIYLCAKETMILYERLLATLHGAKDEQCENNKFELSSVLPKVVDARARFKAWAMSIAAFQSGHLRSSLDYRLRDASEIRERILKILKEIQESAETAILIVSGKRTNDIWLPGALSDSEEDEDDEVDASPAELPQETSELEELLATMNTSNVSLMKLSMVIRSSPARDDYLKAAARYGNIPSAWDIQHVIEKHGSAKMSKQWLLERLGKAITRRRQFLKYREEHHSKLSQDWDAVGPVNERPIRAHTLAPTLAYTDATTFFHDDPVFEKSGSDTAGSIGTQTSYEPTMFGGDDGGTKLQVPSHPEMAFDGVAFEFGEPFQCPYCYTEQVVKNRTAWKRHVFQDLKTYVCTFNECDLRMFKSRNEWFAHELRAHRREWTCQYCQHKPFISSANFKIHLKSTHQTVLAGSEINAIVLQSEEPVDKVSATACPLCDDWEAELTNPKHDSTGAFPNDSQDLEPYGSIKKFRRHLGRHMEQLALFALPRPDGDETEDDSLDDDDNVNQSEIYLRRVEESDTFETKDSVRGRRRGPLRPDKAQKAGEMRRKRACWRCRRRKITCDTLDICENCKVIAQKSGLRPCCYRELVEFGPSEPPEVLESIAENLYASVDNWHGLDTSKFGNLCLYSTDETIKISMDKQSWQELKCYLFSEMLILVKEKFHNQVTPSLPQPDEEGGKYYYTLKGSILFKKHLNQVSENEDILRHILTLHLSVAELPSMSLWFNNRDQLILWQQAFLHLTVR